jgi:LacI family transcriptional regulator
VSKTAVSYALNGTGRLGEDTRQRVQTAAAELGYRVHRAAREVATGQAGAIGAVLSPTRHEGETPNYYVAELLAGVEDEARRKQLAVQVAMWDGHTPPMAADGSVDGLLYLGGAFDPAVLAQVALPAVLVGTSFSEVEMDAVLADNRRGIYLAASHLLAAGCRRLALLNGPHHAPTSDSKWLGFRDALKQRSLDPDGFEVVFTDFLPEAGYEAGRRLLEGGSPPDGLVVGDDAIAVGALHAAQDLGIEVPAQLGVVGYGDSELGRMLRPALSSVRVFQRRMGRLAVRRLADRLRGRAEGYIRILVGPELVVRESSRLGAKGGGEVR